MPLLILNILSWVVTSECDNEVGSVEKRHLQGAFTLPDNCG